MVGNIFKKILKNKENATEEYVPPKPAHRWQRHKRHEEEADKKRQEMVTVNKVNPWFLSNAHPRGQEVTVLFNFHCGLGENELECIKGDILTIESNDRSGAWWEATNTRTKDKGFVPANFVTEELGVEGILDAWHDIDRRESEAKLNMDGLPAGTYIIRPSSNPLRISLSVLYIDGDKKTIKHFKISEDTCAGGFFITPSRSFTNLENLVSYYKEPHRGNKSLLSSTWPRQPPAVQSRNLRIARDKLVLENRLCRGGRFGSIYLGTYGSTKQRVVVKKLHGHVDNGRLTAMAESIHKLHSERIVNFLGMCDEPAGDPVLLIVEHMPGGTLKDFLVSNNGELSTKRLMNFLYQILDGMDYLENMQTFHGELRTENVFLSRSLKAKIGNFGFHESFTKNTAAVKLTERNAVRWAAPEVLMNANDARDIRSDVWAFGVVMYEVFTRGGTPYEQMDSEELLLKVCGGYRLPLPDSLGFECSHTMTQTMRNCWISEPADRPTFRELWFVFEERICEDNDVYANLD